jgi:polysaccharide export outer membrane protein
VGARGFITLPLVGPVEVNGLTPREAEQKIEDLYRQKRLIKDPHINIFVQEQQGAKITVMGAVKKPGTYDYPARRHLMDVLAVAEGLSDQAGKVVQIRRTDSASGKPSTFVVDMDAMVKLGQSELNIEIQRGDVIYVPDAGMVLVDGAVRTPGNYPIKRNMIVSEAILAAGGFMTIADRGKVKLVRYVDGKREIVDINETESSESGSHVQVQDRDIVFVETDALRATFFGLNLNLMGYGMGYNPPTR